MFTYPHVGNIRDTACVTTGEMPWEPYGNVHPLRSKGQEEGNFVAFSKGKNSLCAARYQKRSPRKLSNANAEMLAKMTGLIWGTKQYRSSPYS